jgi:hypothetical protein
MENNEKKLPTIKEIEKGDLAIRGKQNDLNILLNQQPPASWVKNHPMASGVKYLPIEKVEFLLTKIFINWFVEVKEIQMIANSIVVTVRLNYENPVTGQMQFQDGIGAAPVHTSKGAGATEFDKILSDSVMKAAPAAESYAIKDAAEKIGRIFGKDLNRKDLINYNTLSDDERFGKIMS